MVFVGSEGVTAEIPDDLFIRIQEAIQQEPLTNDIHWFRFFVGNVKGDCTYEALKDNEDWEAGIRCLETTSWAPCEGYYSVRLFMVLRTV